MRLISDTIVPPRWPVRNRMNLPAVIPWGRSFDEYRRMFALSPADLSGRILGCADGPASFNAECAGLGHRRVVSCDPLYRFEPDHIRKRIDESCGTIVAEARRSAHRFIWDRFRDPDDLARARMASMRLFLSDFERRGRREGRYVAAALPDLPFAARQFDLCLCSHFLLLYSATLDLDFHVSAVREMVRVAREVRIFPLLDLDGVRSPHVLPLADALRRTRGCTVAVRQVEYEFQRGGNEMIVFTTTEPDRDWRSA